jgi:hypothetical protein
MKSKMTTIERLYPYSEKRNKILEEFWEGKELGCGCGLLWNLEMNFYTCGPHYNKMENKIFHRYPEAHLTREKIELVDFVKLEASKDAGRKFRKLYLQGKINGLGNYTEEELGIG